MALTRTFIERYEMDLTRGVCSASNSLQANNASPLGLARVVLAIALGGALSLAGLATAHAPAANAAGLTLKDYAKIKVNNQQEFKCLNKLWTLESNWRPEAHNKSGGAYGIPQIRNVILKHKDGYEQIDLGLKYLDHRYSSICQALKLWNKRAGYDWIGGWY